MIKVRVLIFMLTIIVLSAFGGIAVLIARGYRINSESLRLTPSGLLVANSDPNGAQIFVNGELKTATNATISLAPATYDIALKKEGFLSWQKRIVIEKEIVTQIDASLFASAPSLSAITFSGASNPQISPDNTKVLYSVPQTINAGTNGEEDKGGLWILETVNLPLGFNREPRRVTDGNLEGALWIWSPDSREALLTTATGVFLLPTSEFTPQNRRVNVASQKEKILKDWQEEAKTRLSAQLTPLPDELEDIFTRKARNVQFSPDETKILYEASGSATLKENLIRALPGSSTQKQERNIKQGKKYVYDTKEDRNFEVAEGEQPVYWSPNSLNIILPEEDKITIADYDGTNRQTVFGGGYVHPFAFPSSSADRLLILTSFGVAEGLSNLYSLSVK